LYLYTGSNKVGQGGYGGSITIEYLRSEEAENNKMELSVPLVGRDGQQLPAVRMDVYEASGSDGRTGKPAGDVGFIHSVKWEDRNKKGEGHYFGFDNDVILKYEETDDKEYFQKANIPYAKFNKISKKASYASILSARTDNFPGELNRSPAMKEAVKMKAIIRQNLVQHLTEIDERKQMAQSLKATATSDSMEQQSEFIDQLIRQIDEKQAQLYQLSRQRSQQRQELRQCYVKPSTRTVKVQKSLSSFTTPVKRNGRRLVDLQDLGGDGDDLPKITCLDLLPTANGNDSALHSILGRMNSAGLFVCADTDKFRQQIADFFQNKENESNKIEAVKNFVLRQNDGKAFPLASARKNKFLECRKQNGDESRIDWLETPELSEEYVRFIRSPLGELDLPEVEFLAKVLDITIHVYEDQHNSSSFKHKTTFNPGQTIEKTQFILYKGGGEWQRLEANKNLQQFCNQKLPMDLLHPVQQQTNSFSTLIGLLTKWNHHDLIASIEMLNPKDGVTPDKLSQFLLEKHFNKLPTAEGEKNNAAIQRQLNELAPDIRLLTERVLEYNNRNVSPVFYLYIVSKCTEPSDWKYEFLLLEMEERLTELPENRNDWRKNVLTSLKNLDDKTVALLRNSLIMATDFGDWPYSTMERILKMLPVKSGSNENDSEYVDQLPIELLSQLPLHDWLYELRSKIWERKVNQLTAGDDLRHGELETLMKEAVYLLLELEYQKGEKICKNKIVNIKKLPKLVDQLRKTLYPCTNSTERDCETIITIIKNEDTRLLFSIKQLGCIKSRVEYSKSKQPEIGENLKKLTKKMHTYLWDIGNSSTMKDEFLAQKRKTVTEVNKQLLAEYLHVYNSVVFHVKGFHLRDTQRVAIMFLINQFLIGNILVQVSTGEGKSLIVAGLAIFCALSGQKVDVVTSNDVLAQRDSTLSVADGGLRDLYEYFNVGVANNCSQSQDDRVKAYNSAVVYGELANFQRDYLLHTFYGLNIRGDRKLDVVIIDEVDCLLLDRGSNTLYLSHDIPGMEMLESLYVFIWEKIQKSKSESKSKSKSESKIQLDVIKSQVLYDLYGAIGKKDLETIHAPLKEKPSEKNELWRYLIQAKIIDPYGRLLIEKVEEITEKIKYPSLNPKLIFFFRKVIERERHIRIPEHLLPFVDRHLDTWLANALRAMELKQDEDYVIDQDRTDTSPDLNPQVIIIDPDTGTDQSTSQWDGALHQFLQLKEGCKLTLQSLKAVFISNEVYIKKYARLAGVSGTLGSLKEGKYMRESYKCDYVSIPTAFPKCFYFKTPKVLKTKESWLSSIINEIRETVLPANMDKARSIVIFCQTIKDVNIVHNYLKIKLPMIANKKVHRYTRDYEQFAFEAKQLEIGHVIIATNLAGRGTDIKISDKLLQNGGLHICLTYLPQNERITEQAMGRSGRKGAPGSGILILFQSPADSIVPKDTEWSVAKFFLMKGERNREELKRIARLQEDSKSTKNQIECFEMFSKQYADLKNQMRDKENVEIRLMCDSALDQWALWIDETDDLKTFSLDLTEYLKVSLIQKLQISEFPCDINWMLPGRSVALAKHLAQKKGGNNFVKVLDQINKSKTRKAEARKISASLLEKLAESNDAFFYPVAPYYLAFLIIKEGEEEKKQTHITKMLRRSETIFNEHIRMQILFFRKINQNLSQSHSFCVIDAYKQQKVNITNLLGHFINSIRTLLGSHYCSASDLEQAGIKAQNVDTLFEQLKTDCIVQQPKFNDDETVPNKKAAIQHAANIHNVDDPASLQGNLTSAMNENEIEKAIKTKIKISCTRKSFWTDMVDEGVVEDAEDFVIMDKSECDIKAEADEDKELRIDFASEDYVFYSPMPYTAEEMKKKIVFPKQYVKDIIKKRNHLEYHRRKKKFEFNKRGSLNLIQLESVNKKYRHQAKVDENGLRGIHIDRDEHKNILAELQNQKIIDDQGYLAPEYEGEEFRYPQCPAYEDAVMGLLGRKFAIEIVIRQWLNSNEDPELLKAIELLPLNPHRNLLADLMAAHVIAGARVKDDLTIIDLEQAVEKITDELNKEKLAIEIISKEERKKLDKERKKFDEKERDCLLNYLRSRQALYVPTKSPDDFSLDFIEREIRTKKGMDNISAELYIFGLLGFDHHIIYENKWSLKAKSQAWISIAVGGGLMVCGYSLDGVLFGLPSIFGINFLVTGGKASLFNGIETLLLRNKSTWTDYGRHSLMGLIEKPDPFEKMSTLWKLFKSMKSINQTPSLPSSFDAQESIVTENQLVKVVATTGNILHDPYRLFVSHLVETINKTVDNIMAQMKKTLKKVWQSHNHKKIESLVKEKMGKLVTDWIAKGEKWVPEVKEAEIEQNQLLPTINKHLEAFALKIRHVTVECLIQFRKDLEEDSSKLQMASPLTTDHFDVEMGERFYKKVVENMKSELARKAEQMMELFQTEFDSSIIKREDVCARRLEATSGNASRTNKSPFLLDFLCLLSITFFIIYIFIKIFLSF
jgi:preprotein translocase subunit SecA